MALVAIPPSPVPRCAAVPARAVSPRPGKRISSHPPPSAGALRAHFERISDFRFPVFVS